MTQFRITRLYFSVVVSACAAMAAREYFISILFLILAAEVWTHVEIEAEDYFFPLEPVINYCKMADECQHDFVEICGQESQGNSRMFKDNCDLFEYNCDEKQQFSHVILDVCKYEEAAAKGH